METEQENSERAKIITWWASIAGVIIVIVLGSTLVTRSYLERRHMEIRNWRPPQIARLEDNLEAVNRTGETVNLGQLEGKVYITGYQYTDCPAGCLGMAAIMKILLSEFGNDPRFHLVSVSVNPAGDTPEKMDAWVKDKGIDSPKWWFLTGDEAIIRKYMISQFKFYGVEENTDPAKILAEGKFAHDQRLALVDEGGHLRGYYNVMSPEMGVSEIKRMRRDIKMVLNPKLKLSDFDMEKGP